MISGRNFRSKRAKQRALHIKIRLIKRGKKPTREEIVSALDSFLDGNPQDGWTFFGIDWARPTSSGSGGENDLLAFRNVIRAMYDDIQFGVVAR